MGSVKEYLHDIYSDSGYSILDNNSNEYLLPSDLSTEAYAFYLLKRIDFIKNKYLKKDKKESA